MKSKIVNLFMIWALCFLVPGICLANIPKGDIQVLIPGHDAKITFQEIDVNKILVSALDAQENPIKGLRPNDFKIEKGGIKANLTAVAVLKTR